MVGSSTTCIKPEKASASSGWATAIMFNRELPAETRPQTLMLGYLLGQYRPVAYDWGFYHVHTASIGCGLAQPPPSRNAQSCKGKANQVGRR